MLVVVTRNVPLRCRGFLASCLLEVAPGTYVSPKVNSAVRERLWNTLNGWWEDNENSGLAMIWNDHTQSSGISINVLGSPPNELVEYDGLFLRKKKYLKTDIIL